MKINFFVIVLILLPKILQSQVEISGTIYAEGDNKSVIPFANVLLFNLSDSNKVEYSCITDLKGQFLLKEVKPETYKLLSSCLGYTDYSTILTVQDRKNFVFNIVLKEQSVNLNEVTVTANKVTRSIEKTTYIITPKETSKATTSLDLLEIIPSLNLNYMEETVTSGQKGSVKILINGINANEKELKSLKPEEIIKIEYFEMPLARFASYSAVVNVITEKNKNGIAAGFDASHAFSTGFANDFAYIKYNKNKSQFSLLYSFNYRNYKDRVWIEKYDYTFKDVNYIKERSSNGHFGYSGHNIDLSFINQEDKKYIFLFKISPNFSENHSNEQSKIFNSINNNISDNNGNMIWKGNQLKPSAELYYQRHYKQNRELIFNVVGTGFISDNKVTNIELTSVHDTIFFDYRKSKNNKISAIAEIVFSKQFENIKTDISYRFMKAYQENNIINSFNNPVYYTDQIDNYLYGEITGKYGKISYHSIIGISNSYFNESFYNSGYKKWFFRPAIVLGYDINDKNGFKTYYYAGTVEPSLSDLSNNTIIINENIISQGNPTLKPYWGHVAGLVYIYYGEKLNIGVDNRSGFVKNYIIQHYKETENYIILSKMQSNKAFSFSSEYSLTYKPLKNLLFLKINGSLDYVNFSSIETCKLSVLSYPLSGTITFVYKVFMLSYQHNFVVRELDDALLYFKKAENYSNVGLQVFTGSLSASVNVYYPFSVSKSSRETIPASIVNHSSKIQINDNASMFVLKLSYNFRAGKDYKDIEKRLDNKDTDSGVFN